MRDHLHTPCPLHSVHVDTSNDEVCDERCESPEEEDEGTVVDNLPLHYPPHHMWNYWPSLGGNILI